MTVHRDLRNMYEAAFGTYVTAAAQTVYCTKWGEVFEVTTTGSSDTLTLGRPTKPGLLCSVVLNVDAGDLTLTVTGGYNFDADTSITFDDAKDMAVFLSYQTGATFQWMLVRQEGTNAAVEAEVFDTATIATLAHATTDLAEHGAGAIGTGVAPSTNRYTRDGVIITEIKIDITGLGVVGTAAKDVIGLAAGGAAYIGRYVVATCGVVFKIEMICLELPGEGTATITADIDLGAEDTATSAYDDACDDIVINTASLVAGEVATTDVPALTANDYLYLIEGDTAATTGVYNAGQYLIRLYGHPVLS